VTVCPSSEPVHFNSQATPEHAEQDKSYTLSFPKKPQYSAGQLSCPTPTPAVILGGKIVLQLSDALANEAALFAAECLLALRKPQGFACIPPFNNTHPRIGTDPEASLLTVKLISGDQQVVGGSLIHVVFSYTTTDPRCVGAGGNFDATVHVTPSSNLVLMDVHPSAVQSCPDVDDETNRDADDHDDHDDHRDKHRGLGRKADMSATVVPEPIETLSMPGYPAFLILLAACSTLVGFTLARRVCKTTRDPQLASSLVAAEA